MKYHTLGNSGLKISEIGLGCGGKFGFPETSEKQVLEVTEAALDMGVNFLDTGSNYGLGLSETRIGKLLKHRRKDFILATKCGSRLVVEEHKEPTVTRDFTYDGILSSIQDSLKRLQTDYVDLIQFHTATEKALEKGGEALAALKEAQKRGYARFLGASCDGERALQAIALGELCSIQISYNVATQDPEEKVLPAALEAGMGVIVKEPVANAFFMGIPKPGADNAWQHPGWERCQRLTFLQQVTAPKPVQAALKYVLSHRAVTTAIVSTVTMAHLKDNVATVELPALEPALIKKIKEAF
jgi:aryl-alcohol dehydrogenase-like predicted oxidoreductase